METMVKEKNLPQIKKSSHYAVAFRRLRKNKLAMIGLGIVVALLAIAIFAPWIAPYDPTEPDLTNTLSPPSKEHPFGTDRLGRDVFSRVVYGSRIALMVGLLIVAIQALIGVPLGLIAGYYGGVVDNIIMRVVDILLSIPSLVLALAIASALGPGLYNVIIAFGVIGWTGFARLVRAEVLSIREKEYIEAAKATGEKDRAILIKHILPNVIPTIIVIATLTMPSALILASALSFLGLGAQPPTPEWGAILAEGRIYLRQAPWISTFPGLAIMTTVLGLNFLGDGLRDALDPRLK